MILRLRSALASERIKFSGVQKAKGQRRVACCCWQMRHCYITVSMRSCRAYLSQEVRRWQWRKMLYLSATNTTQLERQSAQWVRCWPFSVSTAPNILPADASSWQFGCFIRYILPPRSCGIFPRPKRTAPTYWFLVKQQAEWPFVLLPEVSPSRQITSPTNCLCYRMSFRNAYRKSERGCMSLIPLKGSLMSSVCQWSPSSLRKSAQIVVRRAQSGCGGRKLRSYSSTFLFLNCSSRSISSVCALICACVSCMTFSFRNFWRSSKCLNFLSKLQLKTLMSSLSISVMRQPRMSVMVMSTKMMQQHQMGFLGVMSPQAIVVTTPMLKYMTQRYACDQVRSSVIWQNAQLLQIQQRLGVLGPQQLFSQTHRLTRQKPIPMQCAQSTPTTVSFITRQPVFQDMYNCVTRSNYQFIRPTEQNFNTHTNFIQFDYSDPDASGITTEIMPRRSAGPSKERYRYRMALVSVTSSPSWKKALLGASSASTTKMRTMVTCTPKRAF